MGKNVLLSHHENYPEPPPGSRTHLNKRGEPSDALQNLSLSVLDAFGSVHDILYQSNLKHQMLTEAIDALPMQAPDQKSDKANELNGPFCHDDDLLVLKATSQSALACMENALALLQDIREAQRDTQYQGKSKDNHNKSSTFTAPNNLKTSKIGGLLSPMTMSPSRKISNSSTNSTFFTHDTADRISNNSLNQGDEGVSSLKHFGGKYENRPQADTLSVKSANITQYDQTTTLASGGIEHPMASSLSRSTPSVAPEQSNRAGLQNLTNQNIGNPKREAQAQTS